MTAVYDSTKAARIIEFARAVFLNDGAEGESVHVLADQLEAATAEIDRLRHGPTRDALADWKSAADRPGGRFAAWCELFALAKATGARVIDLEQQRAGAGDALVVVTAERDAARIDAANAVINLGHVRGVLEIVRRALCGEAWASESAEAAAVRAVAERDAARAELAALHASIARKDPAAGFFLAAYQAANRTIAELKVDLARIGARVSELAAANDGAQWKHDIMRPVVDAAVAFREALRDEDADCITEHNALMSAVDTYEAGPT